MPDDATTFKARWQAFAAARRLPADPDAAAPPHSMADRRREALEFFSWGLVHGERTRQILESKLPLQTPARHCGS